MERSKINLLSHVFVELTDEKQDGILEMSKSLLQAQRYSKALIVDGGKCGCSGLSCKSHQKKRGLEELIYDFNR